jgi:hypothetical protein
LAFLFVLAVHLHAQEIILPVRATNQYGGPLEAGLHTPRAFFWSNIFAGDNIVIDYLPGGKMRLNSSLIGGGGGTVTSVALAGSAHFAISGSPVTTSGTLTFTLTNEYLTNWAKLPTNAFPTLAAVANLQGATNGLHTRVGNLEGATNGLDALVRTKQHGSAVLTNLVATVDQNVTNAQPLYFQIAAGSLSLTNEHLTNWAKLPTNVLEGLSSPFLNDGTYIRPTATAISNAWMINTQYQTLIVGAHTLTNYTGGGTDGYLFNTHRSPAEGDTNFTGMNVSVYDTNKGFALHNAVRLSNPTNSTVLGTWLFEYGDYRNNNKWSFISMSIATNSAQMAFAVRDQTVVIMNPASIGQPYRFDTATNIDNIFAGHTTWAWRGGAPLGGLDLARLDTNGIYRPMFLHPRNMNAAKIVSTDSSTNLVDTTLSANFSFSAPTLDLADTGISASTYRSLTIDAKGRATAGSNPTTFAGYALSDTSANFATAITDETGSGGVVLSNAPSLYAPFINNATASRVAVYDAQGQLTNSAGVSTTELEYLDGVTSAIQTQLDAKQASDTDLTNLAGTRAVTNFTRTIITATGISTYTVPTGVKYIFVECVGGGAGGGGVDGANSQSAAGGGGGSGAYASTNITTPAASYVVTVGLGGGGGAAGANNGTNGGSTTFTNLMTAPGGNGGVGKASAAAVSITLGGAGASVATGGTVSTGGTAGGNGFCVSSALAISGQGAGTIYGGGGAAQTAAVGGNATGYGAGGGGAAVITNTDRAGGNGSQGVIIVWEFYQ